MRVRVLRTCAAVLGLVVIVATLGTIVKEVRKPILYASGCASASAGQWPEAFRKYLRLAEIDPHYVDVEHRLAHTAAKVMDAVPGGVDLDTEIELLRWLADSGDLATLAELLDRCMVLIPSGGFIMGSEAGREDERPMRMVHLDAYMIDRYEVTNVQYQRYLEATGREAPRYWSRDGYPAGQADHPVVGVGWAVADGYCRWADKRLPTEAEWEKACRGIDGRIYPWGRTWESNRANVGMSQAQVWPRAPDDAWPLLQGNRSGKDALGILPIGSYPEGASSYDVMDMVGNASEWVADWYNLDGYWDLPARNPVGLGPPWNHSVRGSTWFNWRGLVDEVWKQSRCPTRNSSHDINDPRAGFRCAKSVP